MRYIIYKDGERINTIVGTEAFVSRYCEKNGYTYKMEEPPKITPSPTLEERVSALEEEKVTLEDAMCEMDSANQEEIAALNETISALEDAVCEMDAANEERMATIEDALCEMDMG